MGSPAVPAERLSASESIAAVEAMMEYSGHASFDAMIGIEIGGSNGLQPLTIGSTKNFGVPTVDADWMGRESTYNSSAYGNNLADEIPLCLGRAFPNLWQVTIAVQEANQILPCSIASGDGRTLLMTKSPDDYMIDRTLRAPTIEMGYYVGFCARPATTERVHKWSVKNTMSQAWRIGRCIARASQNNTASTVTRQIIDELGGDGSAKLLFRGKITGVERRLHKGYSQGDVVIQHISGDSRDVGVVADFTRRAVATGGELRIPFMNENLMAIHAGDDGTSVVIASVPDLIAVLDSSSGEALGVGEYRYGVVVDVLGIACAPVWGGNKAGLKAGSPSAFGYEDVEYRPLGTYQEPRSVIDEFFRA